MTWLIGLIILLIILKMEFLDFLGLGVILFIAYHLLKAY